MAKGPLAVRWGEWTLTDPQAGTSALLGVSLENTGSVTWRETVRLAYHWLDGRDNPIVWDGDRTPLPSIAPGEQVTLEARVRVPIPPGRYRFAPDLVVEHRAWLSQLGSELASAEVEVARREGAGRVELPPGVEAADGWQERIAEAHGEGYGVVAGSIEWLGNFGRRRPKALAAYEPGAGRIASFSQPLICPSLLDGIVLERLPDVAGLPAYAAPADEPWIYDGRAVLRVRPG